MSWLNLSASKLKTYALCPLWYHWQNNLKLLQVEGDALRIGTSYHSLVERHHNGEPFVEPTRDTKLLTGLFKKYLAKPLEGAVVDTEKRFEINLGDVTIKGILDRLDEDKIGEYKTTSKDYKPEDVDNFQTDIYIWYLYKTTGCLYPMVYHVNNKKKIDSNKYLPQIIKVEKTVQQVEEIEKKLIDTAEEIKKGDFKPWPGNHCQWCPYSSVSFIGGTKNCPIRYAKKW